MPNNPDVTDADATSSFHVNGVNFVFGDGSVHMINSDISIQVYDAMATRAGKDVVIGIELIGVWRIRQSTDSIPTYPPTNRF